MLPAERRAWLTKVRLTNRVLWHMAQRQHSVQNVAALLGKPPHVVTTWLGPYHQFTLPQISELESYVGGSLVLPLGVPLSFPTPEADLPF